MNQNTDRSRIDQEPKNPNPSQEQEQWGLPSPSAGAHAGHRRVRKIPVAAVHTMTVPPLAAAYRIQGRRCRSIPSAGDPGRKNTARRHPRPPRRRRARWASVARRRGSRGNAAASLETAETGAAAPRETEGGGEKKWR